MKRIAATVALALLVACSGDPDDPGDASCQNRECGTDPDTGEACGTCGGEDFCNAAGQCETPAADAPRILDFSTNVPAVTPEQSVRFTLVATDPDGIEDVIGGSLKSPSGASYGALQTASAEGSYQLELSWADVDAVETLVFDTSMNLEFIAEIYDAAGNEVRESLTIQARCADTANESACTDGVCSDLRTDVHNCGACGVVVPAYYGQCTYGEPDCMRGTVCTEDNSCRVLYQDWDSCGVCLFDCDQEGAALGMDVASLDWQECDLPVCRMHLKSSERVACADLCGGTECVHWEARYANTSNYGDGSDCDQVPAPTSDYGDFQYVQCECVIQTP